MTARPDDAGVRVCDLCGGAGSIDLIDRQTKALVETIRCPWHDREGHVPPAPAAERAHGGGDGG